MCVRLYQVSKVGNITEVIRFIPYCAPAKIGKRPAITGDTVNFAGGNRTRKRVRTGFYFAINRNTKGHTFVLTGARNR
jgi:hypothetical protein